MKALLFGLLTLGSISAFAGDCTILLMRNGTPMAPVVGTANLSKCMKGAALLLQKNKDLKNPTVVVGHTDLEKEIYLRLSDGIIRN